VKQTLKAHGTTFDIGIHHQQQQPCAVGYRWVVLPEAFGSFKDLLLDLMPGELSRLVQRRRSSLQYSLEMLWEIQLMRRRILQVGNSEKTGLKRYAN
jgi:hypothetical protein